LAIRLEVFGNAADLFELVPATDHHHQHQRDDPHEAEKDLALDRSADEPQQLHRASR
jgi:hypothetical protein